MSRRHRWFCRIGNCRAWGVEGSDQQMLAGFYRHYSDKHTETGGQA